MSRVTKIREKMKESGIDAVIVLNELNQRYLCGFAFSDGLLLITLTKAVLITDFRYFEMAKNSAHADFEIVMPENRREFITKLLKDGECKTVGFEGNSVAYNDYQAYKRNYDFCEFISIDDAFESLRELKDESEIEKIQKAQDITDAAYESLLKNITPNMTEIEVAAELEYLMRRAGASGFAFDTIAVSADASALPHGTPRDVKLRPGFLTMDFGAKFDGYCSDMTRTVVIGRADARLKKLYNTVLAAQEAALNFIKAGVDLGEADKVARDIIDSVEEYRGSFGHSLGHGVGLFIHELPRLSSRAFGKKLAAGHIVTVEPGIYLCGKYGCRIEDMVAVREGGIYNFTHSPKELVEIL